MQRNDVLTSYKKIRSFLRPKTVATVLTKSIAISKYSAWIFKDDNHVGDCNINASRLLHLHSLLLIFHFKTMHGACSILFVIFVNQHNSFVIFVFHFTNSVHRD